MNSNIVLQSNIYPIDDNKTVATDEKYLSKIFDYNRLKHICSRHYEAKLNGIQKIIVEQQPCCALNPGDPCWGVIRDGEKYKWVSMCTKTDCPKFKTECRKDIPFDENAEECFTPINRKDVYGYSEFIKNYEAFPIESGESLADTYSAPGILPNRNKDDAQNRALKFSILSYFDNESIIEEIEIDDSLIDEEITDTVDSKAESTTTNVDSNLFDKFRECSQEEIISAKSDYNYFVDAGPGTGKTYILVNKINHLVTTNGVNPEGIMVLCFTHAAVDEIKKRLAQFVKDGADRSLVNVDVRTFHSFAGWLINQANELFTDQGWTGYKWNNMDYELSLLKATEIVNSFAEEIMLNWEYFIVDEVQDLTNSLARFVLEIVNKCIDYNCGVTVLGDACQAIYDYEQECRGTPLDSKNFYLQLFNSMKNNSEFVFLTDNHRQNEYLKNINKCLRDAILSNNIQKMMKATESIFNIVGEVRINKQDNKEFELDKKTCMLLRTNWKTLKQSSNLRKMGIEHTLNANEVKNNYSSWISDVFYDFDNSYISKDKLKSRLPSNYKNLSETIWTRLQTLLHKKSDELNVRDILDSIALSKIDDSIFRYNADTDMIISNIHRAKGREYNRVVIDKTYVQSLAYKPASIDEYKVLYVALTRPKEELFFCDLQGTNEHFRKWKHNGRQRQVQYKRNMPSFVEFKGETDAPPISFIDTNQQVFEKIRIGDAVKFIRKLNGTIMRYAIVHELTDTVIGYVGAEYIEDIKSMLKLSESDLVYMPSEINDIYIAGIYSHIIDSDALERFNEIKEKAPNGVWKWVSFVGIGHAIYDVY